MATYFPRGQQNFNIIKDKFKDDFKGVVKNAADGIVFVTNQELKIGERTKLQLIGRGIPIEIFHLERISQILNSPINYGIRYEFLDISMSKEETIAFYEQRDKEHLRKLNLINDLIEKSTEKLIGITSGGNSVPVFSITRIDKKKPNRLDLIAQVTDNFPIFDVSIKVEILDHPFKNSGTLSRIQLERVWQYNAKNRESFDVGTIFPNIFEYVGSIRYPNTLPTYIKIEIYSRYQRFKQMIKLVKKSDGTPKLNQSHVFHYHDNQRVYSWVDED